MTEGRVNGRVTVATSRDDVVLPWSSRQVLLGHLRRNEAARSTVDAFEAVGTSGPVRLDADTKKTLVDSITAWSEDGARGLPEGLLRLRNALADDLDGA